MIAEGNYALLYDKPRNRITILLPQTVETAMNTVDPIEDRLVDVPREDLIALLRLAELVFKKKEVRR